MDILSVAVVVFLAGQLFVGGIYGFAALLATIGAVIAMIASMVKIRAGDPAGALVAFCFLQVVALYALFLMASAVIRVPSAGDFSLSAEPVYARMASGSLDWSDGSIAPIRILLVNFVLVSIPSVVFFVRRRTEYRILWPFPLFAAVVATMLVTSVI